MDHEHFQSIKRPFSVILKSKPTNQVIRYEHEEQASAKIMLEQKADFLFIAVTAYVIVNVLSLSRPFQQQP